MKERGIKILFSIFLFASILMPFSVYGESVGGSSPIIGVNITYIGYDGEVVPYQTTVHFDTEQTMWRCTSSHSTMGCQVWESENINGSDLDEITGTITTNATSTYTYRLYQYEFIFDKTYVGSITFNGNHPGATTTTTYYVNGNRLVLTDINLVTSFTIGSYNLTYAPLEVINQVRQYNFPIESLNFVYTQYAYNREVVDLYSYSYYTYPIFKLNTNNILETRYVNSGQTYTIIIGTNKEINNITELGNNFSLDVGSFSDFELISISNPYRFIKFKITGVSNSAFFLRSRVDNNLIITILSARSNYVDKGNFSTDFALIWGLDNRLLNDVHQIAQGTAASDQSAAGLDQNTNQMQSDFNSYYSIENTANSDFNSALNGINFNDQIAGNQSFLDSASFVKTVFSSMMQIPILSTFVIILCIVLMARIFL